MRAVLLTLSLSALAAFAQLPGQYPYPGGRYPGGPYPGGPGSPYPGTPYPGGPGYPGTPYPNGRPAGGQRRGQDSGRRSSAKDAPVITTTDGILRRASSNQLVIQAYDHRVIWYRLSDRTTYEKAGQDADLKSFGSGDTLSVDSSADDDGNFTAVAVRWIHAATPDDLVAALQTWDLPNPGAFAPPSNSDSDRHSDGRPILRRKDGHAEKQPAAAHDSSAAPQAAPAAPPNQSAGNSNEAPEDNRPATTLRPPDPKPDADDPGPPELRRGKPTPSEEAERAAKNASGDAPETSSPGLPVAKSTERAPQQRIPQPVAIQGDSVIQKAREEAESFTGSLPNFFCQQVTTRYQTEDAKQGWRALDIVTADVAYEDGRETYKNIKVDNKPVNKPMDEINGTRSTGEFASELEDLMSPQTGAEFRRRGSDTIGGRSAWIYDFEVPRERSHWRIEAPSQLYYPAYRGSIWIDKESARVLRIEQQTRNMPALFPFDTVEAATDYDFVRLATPQQYLLPVEAEVLNCQRGSSYCARNKIEFRNYRKFGSETNITFGDPASPPQ